MRSTYLRDQFDLYGRQIIGLGLLVVLLCTVLRSTAQDRSSLNLPFFDNQKLHYGFLIGIGVSRFQMDYADRYISPDLDTLHSVVPSGNVGFKLGFVVDYHFHDVFDVRLTPTVSFNQFKLDYRYTDGSKIESLSDPTFIEMPLVMKYKSIRRENSRMYLLAGINPAFKVSGTKEKQDETERLLIRNFNLSLEFGAGFDEYQEMFKFSPEVRYTWGLMNMLDKSKPSFYSDPIDRLTVHTITFYVTFEGGPSELKVGGKGKGKKRRR